MIAARSSVNARLRTSITTATLVTAPRACAPSSTMVEISSGGRLSTTNQPRSSRHLAAVLRPAPDSPVTTATSTPEDGTVVVGGSASCCSSLMMITSLDVRGARHQRLVHRLRGLRADARGAAYLLDTRLTQSLQRAEMLQQGGLAGLPEPGDAVQHGRGQPLG